MAEQPSPNWHKTPEAQGLLASIIANPPREKTRPEYSRSSRGVVGKTSYTGTRAAKLHRLRSVAGEQALALSDKGNQRAFEAFVETPEVDVLIYTGLHGRTAALGHYCAAADEADIPRDATGGREAA